MIAMEPNPLNIEVGTQSDGIRTVRESNVASYMNAYKCNTLTSLSEQIQVPKCEYIHIRK